MTLHDRVAAALATHVAPALSMDGADLELVEATGAEVRLRVRGGCLG